MWLVSVAEPESKFFKATENSEIFVCVIKYLIFFHDVINRVVGVIKKDINIAYA